MIDFKNIINGIGNTVNNEISKATKALPLEYIYIGYKVSKGMSIENASYNGTLVRDLYLYTYITIDPCIFALMEDGSYKDLNDGNKYPVLPYTELSSKHLARGANVSMEGYPSYSKSNCLGIFNLSKFEDVINAVIDMEMKSKLITFQGDTQLKKSYTVMELNTILKRYLNKGEESMIRTFVVPPVMIDELDTIKTVYRFENDFNNMYFNKTEAEIYADLKSKNEQYESIKNNGF